MPVRTVRRSRSRVVIHADSHGVPAAAMAHSGDGAGRKAYGGPIPTTLVRASRSTSGDVVGAPQLALTDLLGDVVRARTAIHHVRRVPAHSRLDVGNARHDLVVALEAYTSCLAAIGRPVPYALRDELRLQRSLDDAY